MTPEPCLQIDLGWRCTSPVACQGWGYCRERNIEHGGCPSQRIQDAWRRLAAERNTAAAHHGDK